MTCSLAFTTKRMQVFLGGMQKLKVPLVQLVPVVSFVTLPFFPVHHGLIPNVVQSFTERAEYVIHQKSLLQ